MSVSVYTYTHGTSVDIFPRAGGGEKYMLRFLGQALPGKRGRDHDWADKPRATVPWLL